MANWTALKAAIAAVIKTNGNKEITGAVLQSTLNTIVSNLGENATFKGVATPATIPGTPDGNLFYIAATNGVYSNFGGLELAINEVAVLMWNVTWSKSIIDIPTKTVFTKEVNKRISGQNLIIPSSEYPLYDGTEIADYVQGLYLYSQLITENPAYTGAGYKTFTYQAVYTTPTNYVPKFIYCKGVVGGNAGTYPYRSILVIDENGNEILKTNQSGDFRFLMYHNWTIQVTCSNLYFGGTKAPLKTKFDSLDTRLTATETSLLSISPLIGTYSTLDIVKSDFSYYIKTLLESWQTDTVFSISIKNHNGILISGHQLIFGTLTSATGGSNDFVWGVNLYNGIRIANSVITLLFSIWSDRDMALLTPEVYFQHANGLLIDHNFTSLKAGWNSKFVKIKYTADTIANESQFFVFNRTASGNRTSMAGATLFVSQPIISDYDITFLDYNIAELYKKLNNVNSSIIIPCLGDSLTAGAGADKTTNKATVISKLQSLGVTTTTLESSSPTYPMTMQAILGTKYNVVNLGVGGENINTISARIGAAPIIVPKQFILPQTAGLVVEIADSVTDTLKSSFDGVSVVSPLLQGSGNSVNPCYIEGIECTLSVVTGTPNRYKLTRTINGTRDVTISAGTSLILQGSKAYRNPKAAIIWCWQNGGYADDNDLIIKLDKIISNLGTSNFILVGLHTGTEATRATQEALLQSKYGNRFFNWRKYASTNALYDFGITPTTDSYLTAEQISNGVKSDTYQMSIGALPSSLWRSVYGIDGDTSNDSEHMNAAGYMILGYKLIERLKIIGAI